MRNEGTLFAALAVAGFYKKARFPPGYFQHQFLLDVLELLAVREDGHGVERIKREYFREEEGLEQNGNLMVMDISEEECEVKEKGCPRPRMWIPQLKTIGYDFKLFAEYHTLFKSN